MSPKIRLLLLLLGGACLAAGVAGGLARLGLPIPATGSAAFHGALMTSGFLGTVISLERAVALGSRWAYLAPLASGLGTILPLAGVHAGIVLWFIAPLLLLGVSLALIRRQCQPHIVLLAVAAGAWAVGNAIFATRLGSAAPAWWFTFLVLTIAAERLELTRLMPRSNGAAPLFAQAAGLLVVGAIASLADDTWGRVLFGAGLLAVAAWLAAYDVARRTVRMPGFARYAAVALLGGYAWLAVAGVAWAFAPGQRDIALHALGMGFVFSMIFAHAPVIVPVVLKRRVAFSRLAYVPLALLHLSLLVRFAGGAADATLRAAGGVLNACAVALFVAVVAFSAAAHGSGKVLR